MIVALGLWLWIVPHSPLFQSAYVLTPCRMDGLLAGSLAAIWHREAEAWRLVQRYANRVMVLTLGGLVAMGVWTGHFFDFVTIGNRQGLAHSSALILMPGLSLLAVFFTAVVCKSVQQNGLQRALLHPALRELGRISYGVYIFHLAVLDLLQHLIHRLGAHTVWLVDLTYLFGVIGLSTGVAWVSSRYFESWFLRLKDRYPAFDRRPVEAEVWKVA